MQKIIREVWVEYRKDEDKLGENKQLKWILLFWNKKFILDACYNTAYM